MAEQLSDPRELFAERLRTALWIERTLADEVLPELLDAAFSTDLKVGFERHLVETRGHVKVVRELLRELGVHAEPEPSPPLKGVVREHEQLVKRIPDAEHGLLDLAHAEAAAATEHLELATYDSLVRLAEALGDEDMAIRLREVMEQEDFALEQVERATIKLLAAKVESG